VKSQLKRYAEVMEPYSSGGLSNSVPGSCWHAYADLKLPGAGKLVFRGYAAAAAQARA
jgi:hypothetical protein